MIFMKLKVNWKYFRNWCWFRRALERGWMQPCPQSTASLASSSDTSRYFHLYLLLYLYLHMSLYVSCIMYVPFTSHPPLIISNLIDYVLISIGCHDCTNLPLNCLAWNELQWFQLSIFFWMFVEGLYLFLQVDFPKPSIITMTGQRWTFLKSFHSYNFYQRWTF